MALNNPYALSFDGVDDYIGPITLSGSIYCLEFWVYVNYEITQSIHGDIIGPGSNFVIRFGNAATTVVGETIGIYLNNTGTYIKSAITPGLYHVCFNWDGSKYDIYLNGIKQTIYQYPGVHGGLVGGTIVIGKGYYPFAGQMDEIRIWSTPRTSQQIADNMNKKLVGNEAGLMLYYRFDEETGAMAIDSSPNGLDGVIYGASRIPGLVDLSTDSGGVTHLLGATARGRSLFSAAETIRIKGLRVTAITRAITQARPVKIANARATARTRAAASATMLVLFIPHGVYSIDANEIFNRNQPITPDSLANYIEVWVNPLKPAAETEEVYKTSEDDPIPIVANETKTVTIHYKKAPVTEVSINFVSAPTYATIDTIKNYAWGADVTVTSPDAGSFELVATGKPLEVQGRELVVKKNETSILENGIKKYTFDNPFVQDRATAEMIAAKLLAFAVPQADIEIDWRGDPALVLADVAMIPEFQRQGLDQRGIFYVTKQGLEYDGGLRATLAGRKMIGGEE